MVNLQRPGIDPNPIILTYKPALDIIKKLCSDTRAAKSGFVVRPVLKHTVVEDGSGWIDYRGASTRMESPLQGGLVASYASGGEHPANAPLRYRPVHVSFF
jgi:hypothetical protein